MPLKNVRLQKLGSVNLSIAQDKRVFNKALFDVVAPEYSKITAILSFGRDRQWKKQLIDMLPAQTSDAFCLDLACGTGDLCMEVQDRFPTAKILGIDLNKDMISLAQKRFRSHPLIMLNHGDMQRLPIQLGSVDVITGGYALRNAPDLAVTLKEIYRVLKPGGVGAFLDFSTPPSSFVRSIELLLLRLWGSLWGIVFHGNPEVYGYIANSLSKFPNRTELTDMLEGIGLETVHTRYFFGGIMEARLIRKPTS